jgi:hypothetical protein
MTDIELKDDDIYNILLHLSKNIRELSLLSTVSKSWYRAVNRRVLELLTTIPWNIYRLPFILDGYVCILGPDIAVNEHLYISKCQGMGGYNALSMYSHLLHSRCSKIINWNRHVKLLEGYDQYSPVHVFYHDNIDKECQLLHTDYSIDDNWSSSSEDLGDYDLRAYNMSCSSSSSECDSYIDMSMAMYGSVYA